MWLAREQPFGATLYFLLQTQSAFMLSRDSSAGPLCKGGTSHRLACKLSNCPCFGTRVDHHSGRGHVAGHVQRCYCG